MLALGLFLLAIGTATLFLAYLESGAPPPLEPSIDERNKQIADVYNALAARWHPWLRRTGVVCFVTGVLLVAGLIAS